MLKTGGFISIKNRYNHTVENPDNTFSSNPDNIISGLSYSLKQYFDVDFSSLTNFLPAGFILINNQLVNYYVEINGCFFGDGFYVKDGKITEINKDTEVMMDFHILNIKDKTVNPIIEDNTHYKNEAKVFQDELNEKKLQIIKNDDKTKSILLDGKEFVRLDKSRMTRLTLKETKELPDNFLHQYSSLEYLNCPNVEYVGNNVLTFNYKMLRCDMINAKKFGGYFLGHNNNLQEINIPNATEIGEGFLWQNTELKSINLPVVKHIGEHFLSLNSKLECSININNPLINSQLENNGR